ncbi:Tungsten-containing formylmethanofuran dehydrogenase 2 subunit C [Candidatus Methanobinarius endosymbioticus]|uniref:Tungsten-containing formylmethanofuran dehydrogenase 2 subunit C n=1 Tax=Candidatus Methanobinarius endosymbioticus TaxID=2006182 RepID=A0A366MBC6_9EURY|nr:Tungsten-containing formylmethanofuran dehydrogenase 2 subunit C [Candidatus Methanobinarius endosymbioticus]
MFERFKKEEKIPDENFIELDMNEPIDCLCDFTYNFYWNHNGEKMELSDKIPNNNYTFQDIVEHLKKRNPVKINGDAGHRLCSSMGVDLAYFGGTGSAINVGDVFVTGDVSSRMGISLRKGNIYVKGTVKDPIGNIIEVKSDIKGYKKFISITEYLMEINEHNKTKLLDANLNGKELNIDDNRIRDTVGARLNENYEIIVNNNVDLSTGILMKKGVVRINGNTGNNTAALLNGATIIINGNCDDFTAVEMKNGTVIVNGNTGKYLGAKKTGGKIYAKKGNPIHPTKEEKLNENDRKILKNYKFNPKGFFKFE